MRTFLPAIALLLPALLAFTPARAEGVVVGIGVSRLSIDDSVLDTSFNNLQATIGYRLGDNSFSLTPELRIGGGISDEQILGIVTELNSFYGISLRAEAGSDRVYGFIAPSYTRYEVGVAAPGLIVSEADWEAGIGVGGGIRFTENAAAEVFYENIDDADVIGLSLRFEF